MLRSKPVLSRGQGNVWCDVCENQPLEYFDRVAELGNRSVGGWFGGCFVGLEEGDYFRCFPKVGDGVVSYGVVENGSEGPDGNRSQMFEMTV